jgi:outer membrane protein OmpA-like peptidoglycan-associated protein
MPVKKIACRSCLVVAGAAVIAAMTVACGPAGLFSTVAAPATGPPVHRTEHVAPSAFMIVADGTVTGPGLFRTVNATARPDETLEILQAGVRRRIVVASVSPAPVTVIVPGKPAPPGRGASSYQVASYEKHLRMWQGMVTSGGRSAAIRTRAAVAQWTRGLQIPDHVGGSGSLTGESAVAASAVAGLGEAGDRFGTRSVLLIYAAHLDGALPTGELAGDDVIVSTSFLPSTAVASAAQANLLRAGAARAAVLGPEETASQLDKLIAVGLSRKPITESLSGSVLFANDSAVLLPGAASVLSPLLALLGRPGASGVVNGYASTPGSARRNYRLSLARAVAVARFFEAHGISASSLLAVGQGASRLAGPGPSGANRRVVITIEEPSS